jgi:hypothetical protein
MKVGNAKRIRITEVAMADVKDLSERFRAIAVLRKVLRYGNGSGNQFSQVATEPIEACRCRVRS